jgi:hypothetical protein
MPQHATSANQDNEIPAEEVKAAERPGNPFLREDAQTCSPPLAGNDISAAIDADAAPLLEAAAVIPSGEDYREGNNDNVPSGALVVVDNSAALFATAQPARVRLSKPVAAAAVLAVLGLGVGVFAYSGSGERTPISPPRMQLASVPAASAANTAAPSALPAAPNTNMPLPSAPETNTISVAAAPPASEAAPAAMETAQPQSILPPVAALKEEKTAAVAPELTPQPSAALPEPAPALATTVPASPPAQEESPTAAAAPQITPNQLSPATPAQPARSVTSPPAGPARGQFVFVQRPNVNIRNAPSDRSPVIGIAQFAGRFVVARSDGEWVQVAQGPWRGWINQRFLAPRLPRG